MQTNNAQLQRSSFENSGLKFEKKSSLNDSLGNSPAKKGVSSFTDHLKNIKSKVEAPSVPAGASGSGLTKLERCGTPNRSLLNQTSNPRLPTADRCGLPNRSLINSGADSLILTADRCAVPQRVTLKT